MFRSRTLLKPSHYPALTLILQFLAGGIVGLEALWKLNPAVFVETTGVPATLPVFRILGGASTVAYVHYPVITTGLCSRLGQSTLLQT